MSDRVLVRVLLRIAGLLMVATSLPAVASAAAVLIAAFFPSAAMAGSRVVYVYQTAGYALAQLLQCLFGLYLLFRGKWAIALCTRGLSGCCFDCGYDLTGHTKEACPECGAVIPPSQRAKLGAAEAAGMQGGSDAPSVES